MDRNNKVKVSATITARSLSARRAWIEIIKKGRARRPGQVALRKESVDRNNRPNRQENINSRSLSARRAWIEMIMETPWRYLI